ncbi:MAG: ferritin [Candidatus Kapabacteria bacterium]|nr:ferritin [Candidatus Kapabacteria bacterium]
MNKKVLKAVNDQIQAEFESAYAYLAMSLLANDKSLPGTSQWLKAQWQEEMSHAMKLVEHVHSRGGSVALKNINVEQFKWTNMLGLFENVLSHEQHITSLIHKLYELSLAEKDYPLQILLQWFINEQVEEEESVNTVIDRIKMVGESGASILLLDRQLGERQ